MEEKIKWFFEISMLADASDLNISILVAEARECLKAAGKPTTRSAKFVQY